MSDLSEEDLKWLREIVSGSLVRQRTPDDVRQRLIDQGLIEERLGGDVATAKGRLLASKR
jgi:hypothetical protein